MKPIVEWIIWISSKHLIPSYLSRKYSVEFNRTSTRLDLDRYIDLSRSFPPHMISWLEFPDWPSVITPNRRQELNPNACSVFFNRAEIEKSMRVKLIRWNGSTSTSHGQTDEKVPQPDSWEVILAMTPFPGDVLAVCLSPPQDAGGMVIGGVTTAKWKTQSIVTRSWRMNTREQHQAAMRASTYGVADKLTSLFCSSSKFYIRECAYTAITAFISTYILYPGILSFPIPKKSVLKNFSFLRKLSSSVLCAAVV